MIKDVSGPPNYWSEEEIRHNILSKYEADQIRGTSFDPDSIMLYAFPSSWTLNGFGTKANDVLSETDKEYVGRTMYPKSVIQKFVRLTVNAKKRTSASIGTLGEEDLFRFAADKDGRYIVDTRGPTDLVMRLYGPDEKTALIAEDDDSGIDTNARISVDLIPVDYSVQVRHYNREGGTGLYTIKVRRT